MPRTASSQIVSKQVGEALRDTRKRAKLTQVELAGRLGVSPPYVANVEAGRQNLTLGQLANIAAALGAGLDVSFSLPTREHVAVPDGPTVKSA